MKTTSILIVATVALALGAAGLNADEPMARLSDKDVKNLVKTIEKQNRSLTRALDSKFKRSILRNPSGEVQISHYLKDLDDEFSSLADKSKTLASRIRSGKPASAEARQMMATVGRIESLVGTEDMPGEVATAWRGASTSINKVKQAFAL